MKLFIISSLLLTIIAADDTTHHVTKHDVTDQVAPPSDQSPDESHAVTFVQSHVSAHHDDGYGHGYGHVGHGGHGDTSYHRHTVATTYSFPDVYVAPAYGAHAVVAPVAPVYGAYGPGYGGAYAPVGHPVAYGGHVY